MSYLVRIILRKDNRKVVNGFINVKFMEAVIQSNAVSLDSVQFNYNCCDCNIFI